MKKITTLKEAQILVKEFARSNYNSTGLDCWHNYNIFSQ